MTQKKQLYLSPETELLVVRFEENIMSGAEPGQAGARQRYNNYEEDF